MPFRLNRRRWVLFMGAAPLVAQTGAPSSPAPALALPPPAEKAKADVRQVSDKLAAIEMPMDVEPSFHFRA